MLRDVDGSGHFLHRKEGVTQGGTLDRIAYGIGITLLIHDLHTAHPHVMQLWYAENSGAGGTFDALQEQTREFLVRGLPRGYLPDLTKRILVVSTRNLQRSEEHF